MKNSAGSFCSTGVRYLQKFCFYAVSVQSTLTARTMDETIFFPSPNWFQPSVLAVSSDEWLIYGGPTKSLCILEPLPPEQDNVITGQQGYTAHVVNRAHPEKIVCVDISPEWPEKRCFLTGSFDGAVRQWSLDKTEDRLAIKTTHSHEMHSKDKEEVIGVGYCKDGYAVTIGSFGNIVKWDLNSNVAKCFNHVLKQFKPNCMACSPHLHMFVAIGTKQGVLFVLDLNGYPRIVYKVRSQDDEILQVSWCPQAEVAIRKSLKESDKRSTISDRMAKIRQQTESPDTLKSLDERVQNSQLTSEKPVRINEKSEPVVECPSAPTPEALDESGIGKTLPEDSFDETVVQEDDMFDIYKDHEADEFGHKKFQPFDDLVKVPTETIKDDYLADCLKLKEEILKRKAQSETTIGELVEAMDKTQIEATPGTSRSDSALGDTEQGSTSRTSPSVESQPNTARPLPPVEGKIIKGEVESSVHIHKHLLATIGKHGSIRVWSKAGKLVGSCAVASRLGAPAKGGKGQKRAEPKGNAGCTTLLWVRADLLLIADGNSQLLECNPLRIDCKNKLDWSVLHALHSRGLCALGSSAARVQAPGPRAAAPCAVWSAAQDRALVRYELATARSTVHHTCGGFLYAVRVCPYDPRRVAVAVGDGAVRVWEAEGEAEGEGEGEGEGRRLRPGRTLSYWQHVQGKVLTAAWHPHREGLLAFATAESRVGVIDTSTRDKPARLLEPVVTGGIYSLSWGAGGTLYAAGNGQLARYDVFKTDDTPELVRVSLEGAVWEVSTVAWSGRAVAVGSSKGAVAVCSHDFTVLAAAFVFNKMIHTIDWHPQETSSEGPSPYKNLIAVCSLAKVNTVVILEYGEKEDGSPSLSTWRTLSGHSDAVLQLAWSPHASHRLLSTSQDGTVRVWDVSAGVCTSVFGGHVNTTLGACWAPWPELPDVVISGGTDCCLRLWRADQHPAENFKPIKYEVDKMDKKTKKQANKRERAGAGAGDGDAKHDDDTEPGDSAQDAVLAKEQKRRHNKKFLLPMTEKQMMACSVAAPRLMLQRHLQRARGGAGAGAGAGGAEPDTQIPAEHGIDFINMFGNINELNSLLDVELSRHEDTGALESWLMLAIVRGNMDLAVQRAANTDQLDHFLLSIAPCVSFKYWKDATLLYLQQMDRISARGEENVKIEGRQYGGALWRRVATLLSLHDVRAAGAALLDARLYKEAYVLSRTRYMESLSEQALAEWAQYSLNNCQYNLSAVCYIALGDLANAAAALGKSNDEHSLSLAADIASVLGQNTLALHIRGKRDTLRANTEQEQVDADLTPLPSRADLVLQHSQPDSHDTDSYKDVAKEKSETSEDVSPDKTEDPLPSRPDLVLQNAQPDSDSYKDVAEEKSETSRDSPDKTEELLEKLPEKMEQLMKETQAHEGDGDTVKNGDVKVKVEAEVEVKMMERGDELPQSVD